MKLKIFLKFTKIQYRIVKVHVDQLFRVGRFFSDFALPDMAAFYRQWR